MNEVDVFSFLFLCFQIIAVVYAIMTTRNEDLDWKLRSFRILPMFLLPALALLAYSSIVSFSRMCESLCFPSFMWNLVAWCLKSCLCV